MLPNLNRSYNKRAGLLYVYAWHGKGAPCIGSYRGETRELANAEEAKDAAGIAERYAAATMKQGPSKEHINGLIYLFKKSRDWENLATSTKALWSRYLDKDITAQFGEMSLKAFQAKGARAIVQDWYVGLLSKPGKAEVCLTILSRLATWGYDQELLDRNPIASMARQTVSSDLSGNTWSDADLQKLLDDSPDYIQRALLLARHTGLRKSDIVTLAWSEVRWDEGIIVKATQKGKRYGRIAYPPITKEVATVLRSFPVISPIIVTNGFGRPYKSAESFGKMIEKKIRKLGLSPLRFHDLRGTRYTEVFANGATDADAELYFGWSPGSGAKRRDTYGDQHALAKAAAGRLKA